MCASTSSGAHWSIGGNGWCGLRAAAVVLEEQVLGHRGLLVSWAASVVALHLVSGADQSFSTWNHSSSSRGRRRAASPVGTVLRRTTLATRLLDRASSRQAPRCRRY